MKLERLIYLLVKIGNETPLKTATTLKPLHNFIVEEKKLYDFSYEKVYKTVKVNAEFPFTFNNENYKIIEKPLFKGDYKKSEASLNI